MRFSTRIGLIIAVFAYGAGSEMPTLGPENTVNPATGEMGFSLPLAKLRSAAAPDFPLYLNYRSGIRIHQEASPVGLGFSYCVGAITRKQVHMPDDFIDGGDADYGAFCRIPPGQVPWYKTLLRHFPNIGDPHFDER